MLDFYQARRLTEQDVEDFWGFSQQVLAQNSTDILLQPQSESLQFDISPSPTKKGNKEEGSTSHSESKESFSHSDLEVNDHAHESTLDKIDAHFELMESEEREVSDEEYSARSNVRTTKGKGPKKPKKKRKQIQRSEPHPIKNYLPAFRGFIAKYLREKIQPGCFTRISSLKKITERANVTKKMFKNLFKDEEIRSVLADYFEKKFAYRDLMLSRIAPDVKREYVKRIVALEKAFATKRFKRIF